jgi:putative acetyltransferase
MELIRKADVLIRLERFEDRVQIRVVNEAAFGRPDEADLVDLLREEGDSLLSLVAEIDGGIVGHILFSRMSIETAQGDIPSVSLAPMAVLPSHQRRGIGGELINRGLDELCSMEEKVVLVLGHEHYYPRFGFSSAAARNLSSPFPPEAFMALELADGALDGVVGKVSYPAAFGI